MTKPSEAALTNRGGFPLLNVVCDIFSYAKSAHTFKMCRYAHLLSRDVGTIQIG